MPRAYKTSVGGSDYVLHLRNVAVTLCHRDVAKVNCADGEVTDEELCQSCLRVWTKLRDKTQARMAMSVPPHRNHEHTDCLQMTKNTQARLKAFVEVLTLDHAQELFASMDGEGDFLDQLRDIVGERIAREDPSYFEPNDGIKPVDEYKIKQRVATPHPAGLRSDAKPHHFRVDPDNEALSKHEALGACGFRVADQTLWARNFTLEPGNTTCPECLAWLVGSRRARR